MSTPAAPLVDLDQVVVRYDDAVVVDRVGLEVEAGEWVALIGPNGAGKTSLLRAVTGQVVASGRLRLVGIDPREVNRREVARAVALVPQNPVVPPGMTVGEYVLLGRTPHLSPLARESAADAEIAGRLIDRLDLGRLRERDLSTLSGGELQRAVLARALAQQAPVLLLDEPTSALDIGHQQQVLELVDTLRREEGLAVLSAMHDLTLAGQYADRLLLLADGRAVATGPAADVLTREHLSRHYGAGVRILTDECGGVIVVPVRRSLDY